METQWEYSVALHTPEGKKNADLPLWRNKAKALPADKVSLSTLTIQRSTAVLDWQTLEDY